MTEPNPAKPASEGGSLTDLRHRIDTIDKQLVSLANQRAQVVVQIGTLKRQAGLPTQDSQRESDVLKKVVQWNDGPISSDSIKAIYREILKASHSLNT